MNGLSNRKWVLIGLMALLLALVVGYGLSRRDRTTEMPESPLDRTESPIPGLSSPLDRAKLVKIDQDLWEVIEWEETHPGEGREVAPKDFIFGQNGWIDCFVRLDPARVVVTPQWAEGARWKDQPAAQIFTRHGGQVTGAAGNTVSGLMPLGNIKALAQEDAVMSIEPNRLIELDRPVAVVTMTPSPTSTPEPVSTAPSVTFTSSVVLQFGWTCSERINCVYGLAFDHNGDLWAAGGGGVTHWDFEGSTYSRTWYTTEQGLLDNAVYDVVVAPDGALWFATDLGVSKFSDGQWTSYTTDDGLGWRHVQSIAVAPDGVLWFGGWEYGGKSGLSRFDGQDWVSFELARGGRVENFPCALALAQDGTLWVGTCSSGVWHFVNPTADVPKVRISTAYTADDGLAHNSVSDIAVAPDGALWIATNGGGVSRLAYPETGANIWTTFTTADGLADNHVTSIAITSDGTLWFGTNKGLSRFAYSAEGVGDGEAWTTYLFENDVPQEHRFKYGVSAMVVAPDDTLWVATVGNHHTAVVVPVPLQND